MDPEPVKPKLCWGAGAVDNNFGSSFYGLGVEIAFFLLDF